MNQEKIREGAGGVKEILKRQVHLSSQGREGEGFTDSFVLHAYGCATSLSRETCITLLGLYFFNL